MINRLVLITILLSFIQAEARRRKIDVSEPLKQELNHVLKATNELHSAFFAQDEAMIATKIQSTIQSIGRANERSYLAPTQKMHLTKMLNSAKSHLEMTQMQSGSKRQKSLKKAFAQLVNLAKVYRLDNYRIFFCPKDKSVWIQKSWKPKNPIHPKLFGSCGRLVDRT